MIRTVKDQDIPAICNIYNHYIKNSIITFEEVELTENEMAERVKKISTNFSYFVYEVDDKVVGYTYGNVWKERSAYRYTAEATIYIHSDYTGKGIGKILYRKLLGELKEKGFHSVIGGISLPNDASVALHLQQGFKKCGHFNQVGRKFNEWIDVGYYEKLL